MSISLFLLMMSFKYNMFEFDNLYPVSESLLTSTIEFDSFTTSLYLGPLPDSFIYLFLGTDESLLMILLLA